MHPKTSFVNIKRSKKDRGKDLRAGRNGLELLFDSFVARA